ncbi:Putative DUF26-domain receptor-like protein kinase family protein [Zea mays]|uniref:non-specific serine/threonine protein kinase n=1 Tax=Zea mays TaxID=4577 RepID=A0A1D6LKQ5_MAIZE|nr:Putative DUF26-domain receptor-like protein kinase family protein [Zea mays]
MAAGVLFIILGFLLVLPSATAIGQVCGNAGNYTANSTYQSNLASLAAALPANTSTSPQLFATATAGQSPDAVYALALCRGDTASSSNLTGCAACVKNSFAYAQRTCPHAKAASVYDDDCLLGFSSSDILIPANNMSTLFQYWNPASIPGGDASMVSADVKDLLTQTARAAASSPRRFATAFMDASGSSIPTLYSLAQCTPDLSAGDCLACLQRLVSLLNATTSVRLGGRVLVLRCNFRFENMMFYDGAPTTRVTTPSSSGPPAPPFPAPTTTDKRAAGTKPWVVAVSVLCSTSSSGSSSTLLRLVLPLAKQKVHKSSRGGDEVDWEMEAHLSEFWVFDLHQILEATDNFSEENKLGEGGFGPVYKGQLPEGVEIAVKRLASHSGQGFVEFKNEVQLIAKLQHRNLVRHLGCCSQEEEKILVYEYLPNKSLDLFIFADEDRRSLLDWNNRLAIIEGTAEGLLYLHKHSRLRVIHRDLKPSNILLDSEMNPKISDFGLAKIFSSNDVSSEGGTTTRRVVGTYGYMAPEYASEGLFSVKSDVFSFGVLVLEIISGKRNSGIHECGDFINILGYENAADRPTMLDVVAMLSTKTKVLDKPNHPAYFNVRVGNEEASTTATTMSCSVSMR